ncbi:MAG TPA: DinB family protein [Spirochaetia bacterium]|nr:DinB family protein [Spirochaetia bacterium]
MSTTERRQLMIAADQHKPPEIGLWLWALEDIRQKTLEVIDTIVPAEVDWFPSSNESSIGSVLRHIADVEADWLYVEVLEKPRPADILGLFPESEKDEQRENRGMHIPQVKGFTINQHVARLKFVRSAVLEVYRGMDLDDFRRVRKLESYDVTPEWVLYHLIEHEAEHRGQLIAIRDRIRQGKE